MMLGRSLKTHLLFILLFSSLQCSALPEILRVGLFYEEKVEELDIYVHEGTYRIMVDGEKFGVFEADEGVKVVHTDSAELRITDPFGNDTTGKRVYLQRMSEEGSFKLRKPPPYPADRLYPRELIIKARGEDLQCINRVGLDAYIAGVVLAEAGQGHHPEFYKVQAVVCRTYALHNLKKFKEKGIHLCDKVACQVYEGMNTVEPRIDSAVAATKGIVLVDGDIDLITAAYHSNSGGHTAASENAWSKALPYLRPIADPFSKKGRNYRWEKKVPRSVWLNYLKANYELQFGKKKVRKQVLDFDPEERRVYLREGKDSVLLQKIRMDLGLKSTYFRIREEGDSVIFEGRGYGHGVGLSQEGAMQMAELGIPYEEIVQFYYQGVHLVKIEALDFFRDEGRKEETP